MNPKEYILEQLKIRGATSIQVSDSPENMMQMMRGYLPEKKMYFGFLFNEYDADETLTNFDKAFGLRK